MLFRRVLIRILLLFAVAIFVRTTIACDGPKLQVTITSVAHTEVLIVEKSDNVIKWIIVTPQSGEIKGEIAAVRSSLEEETIAKGSD